MTVDKVESRSADDGVASTTPAVAPSPAEAAAGALLRVVEALRLYGPEHAATIAAAHAMSSERGTDAVGWLRVSPQGFEGTEGERVRTPGVADFGAALCRANVAMIGFFAPLDAPMSLKAAECVARLLAHQGGVRENVELLAQVTSGALRAMPLSAHGVRLSAEVSDGERGLDWIGAVDRVLDSMSAQLQSLRQGMAPSDPANSSAADAVQAIAGALGSVPVAHREQAQAHVREFFKALSPDVRTRILDLEPGRDPSHYDAMGLIAEALPVEDVAEAVSAATRDGKGLSSDTVRVFSRLIALARDDPQKTHALTQVVKRWHTNLSNGVQPDPKVREAIEVLLRDAQGVRYSPESHDETIAAIGEPGANASPPPSVEWGSALEQACDIASALGVTASGDATTGGFITQRLDSLLESGLFERVRTGLATDSPEEASLRELLQSPDRLRALATQVSARPEHNAEAAALIRELGEETAAAALLAAAAADDRAALLQLVRLGGSWPTVVQAAIARDAMALLPLARADAGLEPHEQDALIAGLFVSPLPEVASALLAQIRSSPHPWPASAISWALTHPDGKLRREAVRQMLTGACPDALPALADYLCHHTRSAWSSRTDWFAAMAMLAHGEDGVHALASVARSLHGRRGFHAFARLLSIGDALRLCRHSEPMKELTRTAPSPRRYLIVRLWGLLSLLGGDGA
ncbi:MAG: hypothetical protein WC718_06990 [Phycisphaerales bacterium]|jgi:hypothetical protein